jgi:hypothetical protein
MRRARELITRKQEKKKVPARRKGREERLEGGWRKQRADISPR